MSKGAIAIACEQPTTYNCSDKQPVMHSEPCPKARVKEPNDLHPLLEHIDALIGDAVDEGLDLGHCPLSARRKAGATQA